MTKKVALSHTNIFHGRVQFPAVQDLLSLLGSLKSVLVSIDNDLVCHKLRDSGQNQFRSRHLICDVWIINTCGTQP